MFSAFEVMVAGRYLRARRREGFISVIAWFSLIGIALGVATLIIVLSVMNGFRQELLDRILGMNGHITVESNRNHHAISEYDQIVVQLKQVDGVVQVVPIIEGQVMATANGRAQGTIV
ncbi:MAG: Lipoprotein-releasing system transmembrane protein LolC, partial [Alphaproteobacteria bacterium MarineAlpha9_Bin6]